MTPVEIETRMRELGGLHPGWDGHGAEPPTAVAISEATIVACAAPRLPDAIEADAAGGVALLFHQEAGQDVVCYVRNWGGVIAIMTFDGGRWIDRVNTKLGIGHALRILADALQATQDGRRAAERTPGGPP